MSEMAPAPTFIDLFAGAGGFSLGFCAAGFRCAGAIEIDPIASETHRVNLDPAGACQVHGDIRRADPRAFVARDRVRGRVAPAVVIGGPPCQPFTRVGRAKLRHLASDPRAHLHDRRVTYYEHFLRFVAALRPYAFAMENVPGICRFGERNIAEEIVLSAEAIGYRASYALLNSVWYGVPQMRERVFIVGIRGDLHLDPLFPERTHALSLPRGYITSRAEDASWPLALPHEHLCSTVTDRPKRQPAVTSGEALGDLPAIREHLVHMEARKGRRRPSASIVYRSGPSNPYQALMRRWPGLPARQPPDDHIIRFTPRDYETFRRMKPGDQYPEAHSVAMARLREALAAQGKGSGSEASGRRRSSQDLMASVVPPYDPNKFPNRWRKMEKNAPSRTVTAHLGKDCYSHIHYDSAQARTISVREAARLQSYPDAYRFAGSMNDAFRQIGNSVPPLMAYAVAVSVRSTLERAGVIDHRKPMLAWRSPTT